MILILILILDLDLRFLPPSNNIAARQGANTDQDQDQEGRKDTHGCSPSLDFDAFALLEGLDSICPILYSMIKGMKLPNKAMAIKGKQTGAAGYLKAPLTRRRNFMILSPMILSWPLAAMGTEAITALIHAHSPLKKPASPANLNNQQKSPKITKIRKTKPQPSATIRKDPKICANSHKKRGKIFR